MSIPGETILLAAGFFAAQGHFHLWVVIVVAALGAMIGDNLGFAIGHFIGRAALERDTMRRRQAHFMESCW